MEALVLKRSFSRCECQYSRLADGHGGGEIGERGEVPSRVMPGFLGTPAGIRTISEPVRASLRPFASGW